MGIYLTNNNHCHGYQEYYGTCCKLIRCSTNVRFFQEIFFIAILFISSTLSQEGLHRGEKRDLHGLKVQLFNKNTIVIRLFLFVLKGQS
jgi:hypothetical protein